MARHMPTANQFFNNLCCSSEKDNAEMAIPCQILHGEERVGSGVLVCKQHVNDDNNLSKHFIITSKRVINNKDFADQCKVEFCKKKSKVKTFDLMGVIKSVRPVASGVMIIFIDHSSLSEFKHEIKKCRKFPLIIADFDQNDSMFCYVANNCYNINIESNNENAKYVLKDTKKNSDTSAHAQLSNGTVILRGAKESNKSAVGIFDVVDKAHMVISPIWLKPSISEISAKTPAPPKEPEIPANLEPEGPSSNIVSPVSDTANAETPAPPKEPDGPSPNIVSPLPAGSDTSNAPGGQTSSTSDTPTSTTDTGQTSSTSDTATPTTDTGQTSSTSDTATPTTDGGQTPSTSDTATPTTDSGKLSSTSDTATPTTDSGQTSSTSDNPTPTTDSGQTSSTSDTATPTTDGGQTPSTSDTATLTLDGGQASSTSATATPTTDGGQTPSTSDTATLTLDGGQASSISVVTTTYGPQSATVQPGDTSANTTDNQGLPAAGSDHTTKDKLGLQMNIENVPNSQEVLNAIASRYLQSVRPSNSEEFNDFKQYITEVDKKLIVDIHQGSLIITMRCSSFQILEQLWEDYCSGHLNKMGQKCLVTEEILREFGLKEAKLTTAIPKREYTTCEQYFMGLLGVSEQFVSKAVTENTLLLERLSKYLDRESRIINCWRHLASDLNVPPEERRKFDRCTEHSPTEDLFFHLADVNPDLTVGILKTKLKDIYRNDVIALLDKGGYNDENEVYGLMYNRKFSEILSANLDNRSLNGWKDLATKFEISQRKTDQFGLRGPGPTALLFLHISTAKGLQDLTMGQLVHHFEALGMKQLVKVVKNRTYGVSDLVSKVVVEGSDLLAEIGEHLNHEMRAIKNWRNLAYKLGISPEVSKTFDTSTETSKSPTRMMFEWLQLSKPNLTVRDLVNGLENIDRYDLVDVVRKDVAIALEKTKKQKDDSTQGYCTEKQAVHNLWRMSHDTDQAKKEKHDLSAGLREKAATQGLRIVDNDGKGNCMFSALCRQLEIKKGLTYSHVDLRTELVQYLRDHPDLNDFVDQEEYPTWDYYVDEMAKIGRWGDGVILLAAARHLHCVVRVISNRPDFPDVFLRPDGKELVELVLGHIFQYHFVSLEPAH